MGLFSSSDSQPAMPSSLPSQRWEVAKRPNGLVTLSDFTLHEEMVSCTDLAEGEVVVECEMLSVDAFLRTMLDESAFHGSVALGGTLPALGYGRVVASNNAKRPPGMRVMGFLGARGVARLSAAEATMLFPMLSMPGVAPTHSLGLLGMNCGLTAWVGIFSVTRKPRRGETVVVSGASGATGSVAAQLARLTGARVIGIAGGEAKSAYLMKELGLDGAIDYKHPTRSVAVQLAELCPDGVDFYFDTVGGEVGT